MITIQDLYNIVGNKMSNEARKSLIMSFLPPHIAKPMCRAIDANETAEHFQRFIKEWVEYQQKQQQIAQFFLQQYYSK